MNETLTTIAERYTCRSFTGTPVKREDLEAIALAGLQAPTAGNSQRYRLIVVSDKAMVDELDEAAVAMFKENNPQSYERIQSRGGRAFYNASAMIIVAIEHTGPWSAELDCGIVIQNLALAAHSLDIANCINAMAVALFTGPNGDALKDRMQFPVGFEFGCAILLGHATDFSQPHVPDMDKIIWL